MPKKLITFEYMGSTAQVYKMDFGRYMVRCNGRTIPRVFSYCSSAADYALGLVYFDDEIKLLRYRIKKAEKRLDNRSKTR